MPLKDNFAEVLTPSGGGGGQLSTGQQTSICQAAAWRRPCVKFTATLQEKTQRLPSHLLTMVFYDAVRRWR